MISGINNSNIVYKPTEHPKQPLTEDQKEAVNEIILNYDSSSISELEFETMMTEIKDAGITPSKDLRNILEEAGFEMPERRGPNGIKGEERPKPPEFMIELMDQLKSGEISKEELQAFIQNLQNESDETSGSITDTYI